MTATTLLAALLLSPAPLEIQSQTKVEIPREGVRPLSLRVTFPRSGGPYPVVVFSHGMYGSEDGVLPLTEHWAKHGYVVLQPTHADSLRYASPEVMREAMRGSLDNFGNWRERPEDVRLVLDRLSWLEGQVAGLPGKMDTKRIGMAGHSFGAWTTQVVAGMAFARGAQTLNMGDPRPQAFVALAPHGLGGGITESSYKTMRGPMLYISGDNDKGRFEGDPKVYRRQAFQYSPPGGRYLVWIEGAYHNFGGVTGRQGERMLRQNQLAGPPNEHHAKLVQDSTLQFWNLTLKSDPDAKRFWQDPFRDEKGVQVEQK